MKRKLHIETTVEVYDRIEQLPANEQALLYAARAALPAAYAPYSGFRVSAALLLANGEVLTGTNYENAAYTMCLCAERVALGAAHAQFPGVSVQAIAITVANAQKTATQPAAPCGACRQVLCETEQRFEQTIRIILQGETGDIYVLQSGQDLLPLSFDGHFLH